MRIFLIALVSSFLIFFFPFLWVFILAAALVAATGPYEYRRIDREIRSIDEEEDEP